MVKTWDSKGDIVDFFRETGFGAPSKQEKEGSGDKIKDPTGLIGSAFGALRKLFFMGPVERYLPDGPLLVEQEEQGGAKEIDLEAEIVNAMEEVGMLGQLNKGAEEMVAVARDALVELDKLFGANYQAVVDIYESTTLEEFQEAIKKAEQAGLELGGPGVAKLTSDLESTVNEFLTNPEQKEALIRTAAEEQGKSIGPDDPLPEINEQELRKLAGEKIFANSTESLRETMSSSFQSLKEQLETEFDALAEEIGLSPTNIKLIQQTDMGKELAGLFEKFKEAYDLSGTSTA